MNKFLDFFLTFLSQFAGGPGPLEHNLVRFSIPVVFYGALMTIAWSRQRDQDLPREKLLVWGFGLGTASAIIMTFFVSLQLLEAINRESAYAIMVPIERALTMASIIVIAAAFLRYTLDDARLTKIYLLFGLGTTAISLLIALWQWPRYLATLTESRFHTTMVSALFQIFTSILIVAAIILLRRQRNWLSNVVTIALAFILMGELLFLVNYATDKSYSRIICPIGNLFPLLAIPVLGYVYLKEQAIEKKRTQAALDLHRLHLEELVAVRTAEIAAVNTQLQGEVQYRKQAEAAFAQLSHKYELILDAAGEGICGIDQAGRFSFVNPAAARMLGYEVHELVGQPAHLICLNPEAKEAPGPDDKCPICDGYLRGRPSPGEDSYFWRKDKTKFPAFYVSTPINENEALAGTVLVFKDISERKQTEAEIAQRNANLAAQNTIAAVLSRSIDLDIVLDTALDAVLSIVEMEVGLVFLWDPTLEELTLKSYRGPVALSGSKGSQDEWSCCAMISDRAMNDLQAVVKPVRECPAANISPFVAREGLETLISVPLASSGKALGALTLGSKKITPIQPPELELLTIIGQQIGMAIENAHLYKKSEQVAQELTLLHQISIDLISTFSIPRIYEQIVERSLKLLNCQSACIFGWDVEQQAPQILACSGFNEAETDFLPPQADLSGCLRELIDCETLSVIDDTQADTRLPAIWREKFNIQALVCVPIKGLNEPFGTLFLMDRQITRRWRNDELVLIESFVNRAAVALMNARLHQQLEWAAALEERQRIAADIHDGLAQTVSLLGLQIDGAMELVINGSSQKAIEELSTTRETVRQVSVEVRRSIAILQGPPQPRRSIQELLSNLPGQLSIDERTSPIKFIFNIDEPLFLSQEQGNQALFVIQEALLNAHRHAHARNISVVLDRYEQEISISVVDDGIGFEPSSRWWENHQNHFGLGIMHSRAARVGARLQVDSAPGKGTQVTLGLPLAESGLHAQRTRDSQPVISRAQV